MFIIIILMREYHFEARASICQILNQVLDHFYFISIFHP